MKKTIIVMMMVLLSLALIVVSCDDKFTSDQNENTNGSENTNGNNGTTKKVYTVTFDSNGGSDVAAQKVEEGKKATKPTAPTKADYVFKYWTLDGDNEFDFNTAITKDITLTALWKKPLKAGDTIELGAVTWLVLTVDTADNTALLISQNVLELTEYHKENTKYYNNTDIYNYIKSDDFLVTYALKDVKEDNMVKVDVTTKIETTRKTEEGSDYVFLLSKTEAENETYFADNAAKIAKYSDESKKWWLRSEGTSGDDVSVVNTDGTIIDNGSTDGNVGLRPAFWYKFN